MSALLEISNLSNGTQEEGIPEGSTDNHVALSGTHTYETSFGKQPQIKYRLTWFKINDVTKVSYIFYN